MTTRSLIIGALCCCLGSASVMAGGVTLSSVGGSQFALKDGAELPQGVAVRIGTFVLPADTRDQTLATTTDYITLKSWFLPLAEGGAESGTISQVGALGNILRSNGFPTAGDIFGAISNVSTSYMAPGTQLYVWVFNHSNPELATQWGIFTAANWLMPELLGTQILSTSASVQTLHGSMGTNQILLRDIPVSYGNWIWKNYSSDALPQVAAANADPDGDGIANIAEYAWILHSQAPDTTRAEIANLEGSLSFTFKRPRNLPDVTVTAECSPDLLDWNPAVSTVIASDTDFDTLQSVAAPGEKCFWRVRFTATAAP